MRAQLAIKRIMRIEEITVRELADAMGYNSYRGLLNRLSRDNSLGVDGCSEILGLLGYKLVAVPASFTPDFGTMFVIDE